MSSPKRKVTLYFNAGMLAETQKEAIRQDRSVSWIIQAAWKIAREEVRRLPGVGGVTVSAPARCAPPRADRRPPSTRCAPRLPSSDGRAPAPGARVARRAPRRPRGAYDAG